MTGFTKCPTVTVTKSHRSDFSISFTDNTQLVSTISTGFAVS